MTSVIHELHYTVWASFAVIAKKTLRTRLWPASCCVNSRLRKSVTLVVSTKSIVLLCSKKYEKTTWAYGLGLIHFFTTITTQNTLIKRNSGFWTCTTIRQYRLIPRSTLQAMNADALRSSRKYVYYLTNV